MLTRFIILLLLMVSFNLYCFEDHIIDSEYNNITNIHYRMVEEDADVFLICLYSVEIDSMSYYMKLTIPIVDSEIKNKLITLLNIEEIDSYYSVFGSGNIINISNRKGLYMVNETIGRFISAWGTSTTRDIILYRLNSDFDYYGDYIIEVFNVWPHGYDVPYDLSNDNYEKNLNEIEIINDIYTTFDKIITSITLSYL